MTNGSDAPVLHWPRRVLAADDLRRALNGHREVVVPLQAVITPLAAEELRANGIRITRRDAEGQPRAGRRWGHAQERPYPLVRSAVQAAERDGAVVMELPANGGSPARWARAVAECVASGQCCGGVLFCDDPGLVCCVANKVTGLRAVPVATVAQAARATLTLGANLLAVEMPGRTFFELRQILRLLCCGGGPACPPGVACTLQELDGHAHR
jgi:hypothetical protein